MDCLPVTTTHLPLDDTCVTCLTKEHEDEMTPHTYTYARVKAYELNKILGLNTLRKPAKHPLDYALNEGMTKMLQNETKQFYERKNRNKDNVLLHPQCAGPRVAGPDLFILGAGGEAFIKVYTQ